MWLCLDLSFILFRDLFKINKEHWSFESTQYAGIGDETSLPSLKAEADNLNKNSESRHLVVVEQKMIHEDWPVEFTDLENGSKYYYR